MEDEELVLEAVHGLEQYVLDFVMVNYQYMSECGMRHTAMVNEATAIYNLMEALD